MGEMLAFIEAEIQKQHSDYVDYRKLAEESIELLKRQRTSSRYSETEKSDIRFRLIQEYRSLETFNYRLIILSMFKGIAVSLESTDERIKNLNEQLEQAKVLKKRRSTSTVEGSEHESKQIKQLRKQVEDLRQDWQPYMDAMRNAFDFTNRYFEGKR
jgi:hypothetical protein